MLLTCRSTVRSLSTSSAAMARFVFPVVTRRRTWTSRGVRPPARPAGTTAVRPSTRAPRPGARPPAGQPLQAGQVRGGAQLLEDSPGRVQLEGRRVLVAEGPAGQAGARPGPGRLVRC